jgi:hypothetical protein
MTPQEDVARVVTDLAVRVVVEDQIRGIMRLSSFSAKEIATILRYDDTSEQTAEGESIGPSWPFENVGTFGSGRTRGISVVLKRPVEVDSSLLLRESGGWHHRVSIVDREQRSFEANSSGWHDRIRSRYGDPPCDVWEFTKECVSLKIWVRLDLLPELFWGAVIDRFEVAWSED